jgi:hypothetical protein
MAQLTYAVTSVSRPPSAIPKAAPTGAPDANVANAIERACEGGNARARIPIYAQISMHRQKVDRMRTEAGIVAAAPTPWIPLRISSIIASGIRRTVNIEIVISAEETARPLENPHPRVNDASVNEPIKNTLF